MHIWCALLKKEEQRAKRRWGERCRRHKGKEVKQRSREDSI
jgi:hypothetical protein